MHSFTSRFERTSNESALDALDGASSTPSCVTHAESVWRRSQRNAASVIETGALDADT